MQFNLGQPSPKQKEFLTATAKHIGFGGARGGGKSWAVRAKAKLLAFNYAGIKILIVRRSYPELVNNHINQLRKDLFGFATYKDKDKVFNFPNGSSINFMYCAKDSDLDRLQGTEYDCIFLDEATQLSEHQMKTITACLRGVNEFPKRVYYTCNPGHQGHAYIKRIFIDKNYNEYEDPNDYTFIQSLVTDNKVLMETDPEYVKMLEALPYRQKQAWLYGDWNVFEGQFFEEFVDDPKHYKDQLWTHVIEPFDISKKGWKIYRSFDWGSARPFSCGWWAVDYDGVLYRILELYGWTGEDNVGVKWNPDKVFKKIKEIENEHPYLKGRKINGVADPAIWEKDKGISIKEMADNNGVYFTKADNTRIPGWQQMHYRMEFDEEGRPMMYIFKNCKQFIRTIPLMMYDETHVEDLDSELEDHIADESRYMCMARPIKPIETVADKPIKDDPLNMIRDARIKQQYY